MKKWHWFQWVSYAVLSVFMGILIYVTYLAYSRISGFTGQDMAQIQKIRYQAALPDQGAP